MGKISVEVFFERVMSFREKMGRSDLVAGQRRNLLKMLTLSYFNIDQSDPLFVSAGNTYIAHLREYLTRMNMLGQDPFANVND